MRTAFLITLIIEVLPAESAAHIAEKINSKFFPREEVKVKAYHISSAVSQHRKYPGKYADGEIHYVRSGRSVKGDERWQFLPSHPEPDEFFKGDDIRRDRELAGTISTMRRLAVQLLRKIAQWEVTLRYEIKVSQRREILRAIRNAKFTADVLVEVAENLAA